MQRHWNAAKRILIYLMHSKDLALALSNHSDDGFPAYSDATWADDPAIRRSRSGRALFYHGSLLSAWSHPQRSVSLSSTEAEYQSMATCIQESELNIRANDPTPLFCDNQGALALTKNHPKNKHISIKFNFIRDSVKDGLVKLHYISTDSQIADVSTKPLAFPKFSRFRDMLQFHSK